MRTYSLLFFSFFFFNVPATTDIYTLSLHDALPIYLLCLPYCRIERLEYQVRSALRVLGPLHGRALLSRSEEHTSELQSHVNLVCRLLLEKKNDTLHPHAAQRMCPRSPGIRLTLLRR